MKPINRKDSVAGPSSGNRPGPAHPSVFPCGLLIVLAVLVCGCRSMNPADSEGIFAMSDLMSIDRIRGPLQRALQRDENALERGEKYSEEGSREVELARRQFEDGDYPGAAKAFKKIAKKYRESSIGEEAQFRLGECWYAMRRYAKAQDAYDQLFEDYASTRYVEPASRRLFNIARRWLELAEPESSGPIKTVSSEQPDDEQESSERPSRDPTLKYRILPNFHDRSRPAFDTQGRALQALKSIWLNDPTGPLADDALMMTALYHLKNGHPVEADRYFGILRDEYSDSPYLEKAFVLGSHVKLMSYQGPYYDGTSLNGAEQLTEQTLQMFPDLEDRQKIRTELKRVYVLKAQRAWSRVQYWERKDNDRAVGVACVQVIQQFPETRYADLARRRLASIDRRELAGLPQMDQILSTLPDSSPADEPKPQRRVKSVSDDGKGTAGRVRL